MVLESTYMDMLSQFHLGLNDSTLEGLVSLQIGISARFSMSPEKNDE